MALTHTEAETVSQEFFYPTMEVCAYDFSAFFAKLKGMDKVVNGGDKMSFAVRYDKLGRAKSVGWDEQHTFGKKKTRTQVDLEWAYYRGDAMITLEDKIKNGGKGQKIDLIKDKLKEMKEDLTDVMATDLYTQSTAQNALDALPTIIDSTGTYGGLSPSDAANWASQEDGTVDTLVIYGPSSLSYYCAAATFGKKRPNFHLTSKYLFNKFLALHDAGRRYGDKDLLKAGFKTATFDGDPVTMDAFCPDASWYGLNIDEFELQYHPEHNMKIYGWQDMYLVGMPGTLTNMTDFIGQLKCTDRKSNFKLTALDYTK